MCLLPIEIIERDHRDVVSSPNKVPVLYPYALCHVSATSSALDPKIPNFCVCPVMLPWCVRILTLLLPKNPNVPVDKALLVPSFTVSASTCPTSSVPFVPETTSLLRVLSGINVNLPVLSSKPKNPSFALDPSCQRNAIPLSLLSS